MLKAPLAACKKIPYLPVLALFLGSLLFASCVQDEDKGAFRIHAGKIDLSAFPFADGKTLNLKGDWHFWPDRLLDAQEVRNELALGCKQIARVPGNWSSTGITGSADSMMHTGTIALEADLPDSIDGWAIRLPNANTACTLFIDDAEAGRIGQVGNGKQTSIPSNGLAIIPFRAKQGKTLIVLQVSNFHAPYTGLWDSPVIGTLEAIVKKRITDTAVTALIAGGLFLIGLYHLALHSSRRKDLNSLVFGIICIFLAIRGLIMGERLLLALFPQTAAGWEIGFKVEHLSAHMVLPLFFIFFSQLYPREIGKIPVRIVIAVGLLWAAMELLTPAMFHHRFLSYYEYFILIAALYIFARLFQALYNGENDVPIVLVGLSVMILTVINDVLLSNEIIYSFYMTSYGMLFFLFSQALLLSRRLSRLYVESERNAQELKVLNHSLERFIPHEVLGFLGKKSIVDIRLGDFSEESMSVFFLDIRGFTTLSESMTPNDTFLFINSFLERMGPLVRENGGFIDKYMGDGIIALFPGEPDYALDAALAMRRELVAFNGDHPELDDPVRFGIGIHRGPLMLGTIGENRRMDSTVISDTVNTASRLEQLTKTHHYDILVSGETIKKLLSPAVYRWTLIGSEQVKGRKQPVEVYALDGSAE